MSEQEFVKAGLGTPAQYRYICVLMRRCEYGSSAPSDSLWKKLGGRAGSVIESLERKADEHYPRLVDNLRLSEDETEPNYWRRRGYYSDGSKGYSEALFEPFTSK